MATVGFTQPEWRKSRASFTSECVEVATGQGHVLIRDSTQAEGPILRFTLNQWSGFVNALNRDPASRET